MLVILKELCPTNLALLDYVSCLPYEQLTANHDIKQLSFALTMTFLLNQLFNLISGVTCVVICYVRHSQMI